MYRLTDENGLIKGNFNYEAVKEAIEKLHFIENWLEKENNVQSIKKIEDLKYFTLVAKTENVSCVKENFRPYLLFSPVEIDVINELIDFFYPNRTKLKEKIGFIGEETELLDKKGKNLNIGDVVVIRYKEDDETNIEKTTIIVKDIKTNKAFPMGFKNTIYESLTKIRKCTDLKNGEVFANCVKVILKEEE